MTAPFLRRIELAIGPLAEWKGPTGTNGKLIVADGTPDNLRIKFNTNHHCQSTSTPSSISIYNLNQQTRQSLIESETSIHLSVGWENIPMTRIFSGAMLAATHTREGADIVTTLLALPGYGSATRTVISRTFAKGTRLRDVIKQVASQIPGITPTDDKINVRDVVIGNQGISLAGSASDVLTRLSRVYGFSWTIDNGVFIARDDDVALSNPDAIVSSQNGFLLQIEPILSGPFQKIAGVSITSLLHPSIKVGHAVTVDSLYYPKLSGSYTVHSLANRGDSHSAEWTSFVESWKLGGV